MIYTHIVPRGATINAAYTIKVLGTFLEHFKKKRPPWPRSSGGSTGTTRLSIRPPA
jgi:hypothetical protein